MKIEISARKRDLQGTGPSRRMRTAGRVPGILYGGERAAVNIELDHKELTESSLLMRSIVSASRSTTESTRILPHFFASSRNGMESVTTTSSSAESAMRSTAPPESTGWVQ